MDLFLFACSLNLLRAQRASSSETGILEDDARKWPRKPQLESGPDSSTERSVSRG